jgi:predicted site-specific integrase-resolvase
MELKINLTQAAEVLGVDRRTLARYIKDGLLPMAKRNPVTGRAYLTPEAVNDIMLNGLPWRRERTQAQAA